MSENFKVPLTKILEIHPHPNAHSLELATIYGYQVVVKKGVYEKGSEIIYVPIDSIIPAELEYELFPPDSKIKLSKQRVRQIRIRKLASQGMVVPKEAIKAVYNFEPTKLEEDLAERLRIKKYEPPTPSFQRAGEAKDKIKKKENTNFQKYNGLTNIKWCPFMFGEGETVVYQEKIHGTNARAGLVPFQANTLLKKIKKFFGIAPKFEFCYGSNNVQLQQKTNYSGFYGEDIYGNVFKKIDVKSKLRPGEVVYGEIYGQGIQKNYHYGTSEHKFVLFDVKVINEDGTQVWLSPDEVIEFAEERGFDMVPELYRGPFFNVEHTKDFTLGNSVLCPKQAVREGLVVKSVNHYNDERGNKRALKVISEKYLDKDQSDFH